MKDISKIFKVLAILMIITSAIAAVIYGCNYSVDAFKGAVAGFTLFLVFDIAALVEKK